MCASWDQGGGGAVFPSGPQLAMNPLSMRMKWMIILNENVT